jgi:predicted AlkP superfamily pyrophosphatase or phosphodiesterase
MLFTNPKTMIFQLRIALVAALLLVIPGPLRVAAQRPAAPKLVVILVVDQMRGDYLEWYGAGLTSGLRRLMRDGAWFTKAAYPYLNTVTCPGHSTIGTGTFPYRHGMILNSWLDRTTGKSPYCTDDPTATEISYNKLSPVQGDSAKLLLVPAIGEQIIDRGGRSVAISMKPRSAVPLTGHKATAVTWFDDRGGWTTSSAFTREPVPFLQQFIDANPITADFDKVWERTLPISAYQDEDDAEGEGTLTGGTRTFPHVLGTPGGQPDSGFYSRWQRSPYSDEYVGRMAAAAVDALKLGKGESTDFLGVSFSALDLVGHVFGPRSHEVQDVLIRVDRTIGRLLDHLETAVGAGNYIVGLSADHGVAEIPERVGRGGRISNKIISETLQKVLVPLLGPGEHVASAAYTDIYLSDATCARLAGDEKLKALVLDTLRSVPGIGYAFWGADLATAEARADHDPVRRAAALSYNAGRSGDLIIAPGPNWLLSTSVTTHGTQHSYDQRVPVMLFGASVRSGHYQQAATPADLVPTLAAVAQVKIAPTDGRVLTEALK